MDQKKKRLPYVRGSVSTGRAVSSLLVLVLAAGLLSGCRSGDAHARIDPALAPLIPSDTKMLAGFRLDKLKNTPFYKTYVEGKKIPQLEDFAHRTGLDPRKDLWELLMATNGKRVLVFARGKFGEVFGLEPKIQIEGMRRLNYKSFPVYATGDQGLMFLQSGVAVVGPVEGLYAIVDNRDNAKEAPPQALLDLVGTLPGSAQFWVVTNDGGAFLPERQISGNMANFYRLATALRRFTLTADLSQGLDLQIDGVYPDAAMAKQAQDALRGFIGLGRMTTPDDQPELLRLYDGIRVQQKESEVTVHAQAPFSLLEQVREKLPGWQAQRPTVAP